jgi:hypothetical protein
MISRRCCGHSLRPRPPTSSRVCGRTSCPRRQGGAERSASGGEPSTARGQNARRVNLIPCHQPLKISTRTATATTIQICRLLICNPLTPAPRPGALNTQPRLATTHRLCAPREGRRSPWRRHASGINAGLAQPASGRPSRFGTCTGGRGAHEPSSIRCRVHGVVADRLSLRCVLESHRSHGPNLSQETAEK